MRLPRLDIGLGPDWPNERRRCGAEDERAPAERSVEARGRDRHCAVRV